MDSHRTSLLSKLHQSPHREQAGCWGAPPCSPVNQQTHPTWCLWPDMITLLQSPQYVSLYSTLTSACIQAHAYSFLYFPSFLHLVECCHCLICVVLRQTEMLQHFISVLSSPFLFLNAQQGAPRGGALQDKSRRILQQIPETLAITLNNIRYFTMISLSLKVYVI